MFNCNININSPKETTNLAKKLARIVRFNTTVCLIGDLGTGKTFFSKSLIKALCKDINNIPSPSYNLLNIYTCQALTIWHLDLYRINHEDEIIELDLLDALNHNLVIIEWANKLNNYYPNPALTLEFTLIPQQPNSRLVHLRCNDTTLINQLQIVFKS